MKKWIGIAVILILIVAGGIYILIKIPDADSEGIEPIPDIPVENGTVEKLFGEACANVGEKYSKVFDEYPKVCCEGLKEWMGGMNTAWSIGEECYATGMLSGNPVGRCLACGDGVCDEREDICNCKEDCTAEDSRYKTVEEFCTANAVEGDSMNEYCKEDLEDLPICDLCVWE